MATAGIDILVGARHDQQFEIRNDGIAAYHNVERRIRLLTRAAAIALLAVLTPKDEGQRPVQHLCAEGHGGGDG